MARTAHSPSSSGGTSHSSRPLCRTLDESIEDMRQIADGGNDILAGRRDHCGLVVCHPATYLGYELTGAGMLILAGGRPRSADGL